MKNIAILILTALLVNQSLTLSCIIGFYDPGSSIKCMQCPAYYTLCTSATSGVYHERISGYVGTSTITLPYCPSYGGGTILTKYNKQTNSCQFICKTGCLTCEIDYDFCTSCQNGYVWIPNDYVCIPAVIGLQAASLALLVITLIFAIIGCCYVIRAKKQK